MFSSLASVQKRQEEEKAEKKAKKKAGQIIKYNEDIVTEAQFFEAQARFSQARHAPLSDPGQADETFLPSGAQPPYEQQESFQPHGAPPPQSSTRNYLLSPGSKSKLAPATGMPKGMADLLNKDPSSESSESERSLNLDPSFAASLDPGTGRPSSKGILLADPVSGITRAEDPFASQGVSTSLSTYMLENNPDEDSPGEAETGPVRGDKKLSSRRDREAAAAAATEAASASSKPSKSGKGKKRSKGGDGK